MSHLYVDTCVVDHPAIHEFARQLGVDLPVALVYYLRLRRWLEDCNPALQVGVYRQDVIAKVVGWTLDPHAFCAALEASHVLFDVEDKVVKSTDR